MYARKELSGFEIFGCPVHFDNNMIRLKDIQSAYLNSGGVKSETATKPSKWLRLDSVNLLVDYLESDDEVYSTNIGTVINLPRGDKGGLYVCRELAHHYASWLDVRYAVTVLRTFDKAAQGDIRGALLTAATVTKKIYKEDLDARIARIKSEDIDPNEYIGMLLSEIAYGVSGEVVTDPMELSRFLMGHPDAATVVNRLLNSMETSWHCIGDNNMALETVMHQYREDPSVEMLSTIIKEYYANT